MINALRAILAEKNVYPSNVKYGALYNWFAVNTGKLAPQGKRALLNNSRALTNDCLVLVCGLRAQKARKGSCYKAFFSRHLP